MSACSSGNIKRSLEKAKFFVPWLLTLISAAVKSKKKNTCRTGVVSFLRFFPGEWWRVLGKRRAMAGVWISRLGLASICLRLPRKRNNKNTKIFYVFFSTFTTEALFLGRKRHCESEVSCPKYKFPSVILIRAYNTNPSMCTHHLLIITPNIFIRGIKS